MPTAEAKTLWTLHVGGIHPFYNITILLVGSVCHIHSSGGLFYECTHALIFFTSLFQCWLVNFVANYYC